MFISFRNEDILLLSEELDEDAVQILIRFGLSNIFPEQCNEWDVAMKDTRQRNIEADVRELLRGMLLKFIRDINKVSSEREAS